MKEKKRVLIVDYDRSSLDSLKEIFEREGYQVYAAKDGEEACAFFFSKKPDLVVLEPFLPHLHGFDFLGKASEKFTKPFPLIIVTGFYSEALCRRDYLSYFDNCAFFNKPYQEKELLQAASRLLNTENGGQDKESQRPEVFQPGISETAEIEEDSIGLPDPLNKVRSELEDLLELAKERKAKKAESPELKGEAGMEVKERDDLDLIINDYLQKLKSEERESQDSFEEDVDEEIESLIKGELSGLLSSGKEGQEKIEDKQSVRDEKKLNQRIDALIRPGADKERAALSTEEKKEEKIKVEAGRPGEKDGDGRNKRAASDTVQIKGAEAGQAKKGAEEKKTKAGKPKEACPKEDTQTLEEEKLTEKASSSQKKAETSRAKPKKEETEVRGNGDSVVGISQARKSQSTGVSERLEKNKDDKEIDIAFSSSIFEQVKLKRTFPSFLPLSLGAVGVGVVLTLLFIFLPGKSPAKKSSSLMQANLVGQTQKVAPTKTDSLTGPVAQASEKEATGQDTPSSIELKGRGMATEFSPPGEGKATGKIDIKKLSQDKKGQEVNQQTVEPLIIPLDTPGGTLKKVTPPAGTGEGNKTEVVNQSKNKGQAKEEKPVLPVTQAKQEKPQENPASAPAELSAKINPGDLVPLNIVDKPPRVIEKASPKYPPQALRFGVKGKVVIMALISENGYVLETRLLRGIEKSFGLNEASLEAVMKWRFEPAEKDGVKVKVWKPISFVFQGKDTTQEESPWN